MNQILVTGEETISKEKTKKEKIKKEKKLVDIKKIVIFFSISIIILGICIIMAGVYSKIKIEQTIEENTNPTVGIQRNDDNNTVEIKINHVRGIKTLSYRWNDEKETVMNGNNQKTMEETIELIGGTNTLTVTVIDEKDKKVTYQQEYTAGNIPEIQLESVSNGVKIISSCEDGIEKITYNWDDGEGQEIEVKEKQYEGIINAPKGQHTLKIIVTSLKGLETTKTQVVVGDTEPTLEISAENGEEGLQFVFDAKDDEQITKIEVVSNDQSETIEVNDTQYHGTVKMQPGKNTLIITVYNINGITTTKGAMFNNE